MGIQLITCLRFSIQLMVSEAAFLVGRPRKEHFRERLLASLFSYTVGVVLLFEVISSLTVMTPMVSMLFFFGMFVLTLLGIRSCFVMPWIEVLFVGTGGYATEHITFAAVRIIQYFTGWNEAVLGVWPEYLIFRLFSYILVAWIVYVWVLDRNCERGEFCQNDIRFIYFSMVILLAAIILSAFYTTGDPVGENEMYRYVICPAYSMLCCILVIALEQYLFREKRLSREKETMEQLLQMANAQQKSSREAIDIINIKCHDLKHQIKQLQKIENEGERCTYIEEIRNAISIYDATYHTGCEALDYILREKTLISDERGIAFSCMADGKAVDFMDRTDLYALLGNALDNALEQEEKEDEEKRIISLNIHKRGLMSILHLENTCSNPPDFREGVPQTTKPDKNNHGFGVTSMSYIVKKYDGDMMMHVEDGKFILDIALPFIPD